MIFQFKDYYFQGLENTKVLILFGEHEFFKNALADTFLKLKTSQSGSLEGLQQLEIFDEFLGKESKEDNGGVQRVATVGEFQERVKVPSLFGPWIGMFSIDEISEKEEKILLNYAKKPSQNGVLVITSREFKRQLPWYKEKVFESSLETHLFKLQFPTKRFMRKFILEQVEKRGFALDDKALELLLIRVANNYDAYQEILDKLGARYYKHRVSYTTMVEELKGVDYYDIDSFLERLTEPKKSKKPSKNTLLYKMLNSLIENNDAVDIVKKLSYKIQDCIAMRKIINQGFLPVGIAYSVAEVKEKLDEEKDKRLMKLTEFQFKRLSRLSTKTTLMDWQTMLTIIRRASKRNFITEEEARLVLFRLVERANFNEDQLLTVTRMRIE